VVEILQCISQSTGIDKGKYRLCYSQQQNDIANTLFLIISLPFFQIDNWFEGKVTATDQDGETIALNDLEVDRHYNLGSLVFQELVSMMEIIFHGLSGGSERGTTVEGLLGNGLRLDGALHLYFVALHEKHYRTQNSNGRRAVNHRIPQSAVVLVLLFRKICILLGHSGAAVFPRILGRRHFMKDSIGNIFGFQSSATSKIDIRKLYTSICNCVFADPTKGTLRLLLRLDRM
jgi:hypothetical protein